MEFDASQTREFSVKLRLKVVPHSADGYPVFHCLCCRGSLELHQPDADLPERMLATCPGCHAWHIVTCPAAAEHVIVVLPDPSSLASQAPDLTRPRRRKG